MLGDTGRSFVVGYGVNPPQKPHHRGAYGNNTKIKQCQKDWNAICFISSCPNRPSPCDYWNGMSNPDANYQTLYGALVGGPGTDDSYMLIIGMISFTMKSLRIITPPSKAHSMLSIFLKRMDNFLKRWRYM